ncbi:helix-turn-helix domain-containing protein [Nocardia sp. NBC_01009]|uniref:helix-turn-helix domain-containing protein n=1 Tax=Nocardia sp. NBC_01009 TaxID=2975996 RepID=UPI00386B75CA|nr:helix-turn-helix domain-containing protein [Nocardia sp. NBC_01009]
MSPRTLSGRLREEGTSFRVLVDEVRQMMSKALLTHTGMTTEQVAAQLGYAEAASFIRAFRRWGGRPPQEFRARASGSRASAAELSVSTFLDEHIHLTNDTQRDGGNLLALIYGPATPTGWDRWAQFVPGRLSAESNGSRAAGYSNRSRRRSIRCRHQSESHDRCHGGKAVMAMRPRPGELGPHRLFMPQNPR